MATFPKRRSLAITTFVSASVMIVALLFTNAHNAPLDELGCHRDPPGGKYHCHTGQLKGKEFTNKEEAERAVASVKAEADENDFAVSYEDTPEAASEKVARNTGGDPLLPPPPEVPTAVMNQDMLKIISWNVKKRDKVDYDRLVSILLEADIATLQDLDLDEKGKGPLHIIGDLVQSRVGSKVCRMWFKNSAQGRERFGVLWRQSTIGFVNESGEMKDKCGEMAVVMPTNKVAGARAVASGTFYSKVQKKMFQLGTVNLGSRPGNPSKDIPGLFRPLEESKWPTIVTGDVKYPNDIKGWNFKTAIHNTNVVSKKGKGSKYTSENIWTRNAVVVRALHINLYDRFSELKPREIDSTVSNSFPMLAEVALVAEADDQLNTVIIKSQKKEAAPPPKKEAPKAKIVSEAPKDNFEEPDEDLEAEARSADGQETRKPAAAKSTPKKKKNKKR